MKNKIIELPLSGAGEIRKCLLLMLEKLGDGDLDSIVLGATMKSEPGVCHLVTSESGKLIEKLGLISMLDEQIKRMAVDE